MPAPRKPPGQLAPRSRSRPFVVVGRESPCVGCGASSSVNVRRFSTGEEWGPYCRRCGEQVMAELIVELGLVDEDGDE
jgi:hypothetical protein